MKRNYILTIALLGLFFFAACDKNDSYMTRLEDERNARSEYLKKNGITEENLLNEGVYYQELYTPEDADNKSKKVEIGDEVVFYYTSYFLDGRVFQSNVISGKFEPLTVRISNTFTGYRIRKGVVSGTVISGWPPALLKMSEGTKALVVIPSSRARVGYGAVPSYTTLVSEIEVEEVRKNN